MAQARRNLLYEGLAHLGNPELVVCPQTVATLEVQLYVKPHIGSR
jgi:DNA-binding phage protein